MGPLYGQEGQPPTPQDVGEVVGRMWDNLWGRQRNPPGEDIEYAVSVSLEEVGQGTTRTATVPRRVRCGTCTGLGAPKEGRTLCEACKGSGRSAGPRLFRTQCYHCQGRGYTIQTPCVTCGGGGTVWTEDSLSVKIPPGVATGTRLRLSGRGHEPAGDGTAGHLFVVVDVPDHPLFRRRGDDLLVDLPLAYRDAALGADVEVPTLEGTTVIRIPAGTPPGRVFRLSGRGLPHHGKGGRGDLHLEVQLEVPSELGDDERLRLAAWHDALPDTRHPQRAAFREALDTRRQGDPP